MQASRVNLISAIIAAGILAGCGAPQPPKPVNARLPNDVPLATDHEAAGQADVGLLAQCKKINEYAKTVEGNWEDHWYFAQWDVIEVTEGQWESPTLTFIFADRWPTPESGIMLMKMPLLYAEGRVFEFWLDMSKKVPLIVAQEQRSRIPPHGPLEPSTLNYQKPDDRKVYEAIVRAAADFFFRNQQDYEIHGGGLSIVEKQEDFFLVEHGAFPRSLAVTVDKDTREVRWVDSASTE